MTTITTTAGAVSAVAILDGATGLPVKSVGTPNLQPQARELVAVSTTVLRVSGASSWTGATANGAAPRLVSLTNQDTTNALYISLVAVGASLTGAVATTDYELMLGPGESLVRHLVPAGFDLCVVRGAGSGNVRAQEFLL